MTSDSRKAMVGGIVVAGVFVYFAYDMAQVKAVAGYDVSTVSYKIGGLKKGSDVRLGGKYVRLEPGTEKTYLAAGGRITNTHDFRSLEDQVGEIIFLATGGSNSGGE